MLFLQVSFFFSDFFFFFVLLDSSKVDDIKRINHSQEGFD